MDRVTYAMDRQLGVTWSRLGNEVAIPILTKVEPYMEFDLEKHKVDDLEVLHHYNDLKWTNKLPVSIKNYHRNFWGLKPLEEE